MAGSSPFNVNFFSIEFAEFSEKHLGKTPLCMIVKFILSTSNKFSLKLNLDIKFLAMFTSCDHSDTANPPQSNASFSFIFVAFCFCCSFFSSFKFFTSLVHCTL